MDLTLSQANIAFREEVKAFLKEALTPVLKRAGLYMTSVFSDFEASLAWQKILLKKVGLRQTGRWNTAALTGRWPKRVFSLRNTKKLVLPL